MYGHVPAYANLTELFEVVALADLTPARLEMVARCLALTRATSTSTRC